MEHLTQLRREKVKPCDRPNYYAVFIDLKKAYDRVDRSLLMAKMIEMGLDASAIQWSASWLSINSIETPEGFVKTEVSVP